MKIVSKTARDLIPKFITDTVINNTKEFVNGDLLSNLQEKMDITRMMEESAIEVEKRGVQEDVP